MTSNLSDNKKNRADLLHLIYETAIDNSLWPDMILQVVRELENQDQDDAADLSEIQNLQTHFVRALQISEQIIDLKEQNDTQYRVLKNLAVNILFFDAQRRPLYDSYGQKMAQTPLLHSSDNTAFSLLPKTIAEYQKSNVPVVWSENESNMVNLLFGPNDIRSFGLPQKIQWIVVRLRQSPRYVSEYFATKYMLSESRRRLLEAFIQTANLKDAANLSNLSYESARTYFKDICEKTGASGQTDLLKKVLLHPVASMNPQSTAYDKPSRKVKARHLISCSNGSELEYFMLGEKNAYPLITYDALTGGALDILAFPERYEALLNRLGVRLIILCRPGTFRSSFREQNSARDYAEDVAEICDHLQIDRFSLLAYSYGSVAALGVAHELQDRVDRLTLASVYYPDHIEPAWKNFDFFYQILRVIGRRWPGFLRRIIPFLCNSILQNIDSFTDRAAARAKCEHEVALLMTPQIRERSHAMLEMRIANGIDGLVQEYQIIAKPFDFDCKDIKIPVQIFHGDCDQINPLSGAKALANHLPKANLNILPGRGHAFIYAEWDWILAAAMGAPFEIPPPTRRGILTDAK